jgi:small-conductance mechanosensitive channel
MAPYLTPPNDVKEAIAEAIRNAPLAMATPTAEVTVKGFGESSVDYLAQFWIEDYAVDRRARDQVRTNIWYEFRRRNIEIPWPIQIQYERDEERSGPIATSIWRLRRWRVSICLPRSRRRPGGR